MAETPTSYQSTPNTNEENALGKKFFVFEAGNTNGAHHFIVRKMISFGQREVNSLEECDYILVFCPAVTRVGTDINDALSNMPRGKPAILVVMHHTFNSGHVVTESRRQVDDPHVRLTVDCLFHEGKLLKSNQNEIMWHEVKKFLRVPPTQMSSCQNFMDPWMILLMVFISVCVVVVVVIFAVYMTKMHK